MEKRFLVFVALMFVILWANTWFIRWMRGPQPANQDVVAKTDEQPADKTAAEKTTVEKTGAEKTDAEKTDDAPAKTPAEAPAIVPVVVAPETWATLGSVDPAGKFRMLVTIASRGAAVERIELSDTHFRELEDADRSGYLGHLEPADNREPLGVRVQVVPPGTPAAGSDEEPKLKVGDVITAIDDTPTHDRRDYFAAMAATRPRRSVRLSIVRDGREQQIAVELTRRPLQVVQPEIHANSAADPLSLLMTLQQVGEGEAVEKNGDAEGQAELKGVDLLTRHWRLASQTPLAATFETDLPQYGLTLRKIYRLEESAPLAERTADARDYHFSLEVQIENSGKVDRRVAYRLDGPNGLPQEGWWYASKVQGTLRDAVVRFEQGKTTFVSSLEVSKGGIEPFGKETPRFIGVDAQYFASVLMPQRGDGEANWVADSRAIKISDGEPDYPKTTNVSVRLFSEPTTIKPGADHALKHTYLVFAGPKQSQLLANYEAGDLLNYGWFGWVARPMTGLLHIFHAAVRNYGLAILMLTVVDRLGMFALSVRQARGAQKMQLLAPEMKAINEKFKKSPEQRTKALQELFRKHNYNPLGGCGLVFLQLPIFIGLYRALSADVELRQAPLFGETLGWCDNLAAPDMLFNWTSFMPGLVTKPEGFLSLGPFFNLLPIVTVGLFMLQQKLFMPPPADEQQAMQQKMMKFVMILTSFMFYKVASGLCLYFIASTLWGLGERKFLPKTATTNATTVAAPRNSGNGAPRGSSGKKAHK